LPAKGQRGLCWAHSPENAERRRRTASRGGKAKTSKLYKTLHELLANLTQRVIDGELETSRGAVANQLISTRVRLLDHERKVKETEEFEQRITELEEAQARRGRASS